MVSVNIYCPTKPAHLCVCRESVESFMGLEEFKPIFGQPNTEWLDPSSTRLKKFLLYVDAPDPSNLRILVTDFDSNTWVAVRSIAQLEDIVSFFLSPFNLLAPFSYKLVDYNSIYVGVYFTCFSVVFI